MKRPTARAAAVLAGENYQRYGTTLSADEIQRHREALAEVPQRECELLRTLNAIARLRAIATGREPH